VESATEEDARGVGLRRRDPSSFSRPACGSPAHLIQRKISIVRAFVHRLGLQILRCWMSSSPCPLFLRRARLLRVASFGRATVRQLARRSARAMLLASKRFRLVAPLVAGSVLEWTLPYLALSLVLAGHARSGVRSVAVEHVAPLGLVVEARFPRIAWASKRGHSTRQPHPHRHAPSPRRTGPHEG